MRGEHLRACARTLDASGSSPHARGAHLIRDAAQNLGGIIPACAGSTRSCAGRWPRCRDHPRMRGEHRSAAAHVKGLPGSSPHARGALRGHAGDGERRGIIPACAGSTRSRRATPRRSRDHPRMRGEHTVAIDPKDDWEGSSPHARGARGEDRALDGRGGIIPACAGSTPGVSASSRPRKDHPRMRGEHSRRASATSRRVGSSPHARGAHRARYLAEAPAGIIPACAGSTAAYSMATSVFWDHPRMRGEHTVAIDPKDDWEGSSPHARGAPRGHAGNAERRGIIPACAGSTSSKSRAATGIRDHPRMRGEHPDGTRVAFTLGGSSPHARGAPNLEDADVGGGRIIPACAGSTPTAPRTSATARDHPRMRGEHTEMVQSWDGWEGSSPHARGAPRKPRLRAGRAGIIPACAGSTSGRPPAGPTSWDHPRMRGEHGPPSTGP